MNKYLWVGIAALLCAAQAWAGEVNVSGAWARATAPGQTSAVVQFSITSQEDANLLAVSSPAAEAAGLHGMTHDNGVMKMRSIKSLLLPGGKQVTLGSSGNHVMLVNLKQPLKEGGSIPLILTVQFADRHKERIKVSAEIRPLTTSSGMHDHGDHHDHH